MRTRRPGKPNRTCVRCGTPFYASPSRLARGGGSCCSHECAHPRLQPLRGIEARNALTESHLWIVDSVIISWFRFAPCGVDPGDLLSIGFIGLLKAAEFWDPARGPFEMYARAVVRTEIQDALRKHGRRGDFEAASLQDLMCDDGNAFADGEADPRPGPEETVIAGALWATLRALPLMEATAIRLTILHGLLLREAATVEGCTSRVIQQRRARGLSKMRVLMEAP